MIRKEAWSFYRTSSGVRLCWELEEPKGPKGLGGIGSSLKVLKAGCGQRDPAIRKDAGLYCGSRLRSGEVFAYVGRNQNLKDLKDPARAHVRGTYLGGSPPARHASRSHPKSCRLKNAVLFLAQKPSCTEVVFGRKGQHQIITNLPAHQPSLFSASPRFPSGWIRGWYGRCRVGGGSAHPESRRVRGSANSVAVGGEVLEPQGYLA